MFLNPALLKSKSASFFLILSGSSKDFHLRQALFCTGPDGKHTVLIFCSSGLTKSLTIRTLHPPFFICSQLIIYLPNIFLNIFFDNIFLLLLRFLPLYDFYLIYFFFDLFLPFCSFFYIILF